LTIGKNKASQKGYSYHLFVLPRDPDQIKWDGETIGTEGAIKHYNADEALPNSKIASDLPRLLADAKHIYVSFPTVSGSISDEIRPRTRFLSHVSRLLPFLTLDERYKLLAPYLHSLRAVKSAGEIACMRTAGRITGNAFNEVIRRNLSKESDIEATLEFLFRMGGCEKSAYVPVVAGGENALTIHYTRNEMGVRDGEMVLVDAGGLYEGYVADITRTWPVSKTFSEPQRDLYQVLHLVEILTKALLNVQKECVKMCVEDGQRTMDDIHRESVELLTRELWNLNLQLTFRVGGLQRVLI
jgi:intermediate cleaving peptidase 55